MLKKPDLMDFLPKQGGAKPAQPEAPKPQYKMPVSPIVSEVKKNQDATKAKAEASYKAELKRKAEKAVQVPVHTKYGTAYSPQKGWELLTPDQKKAELSRLKREIEDTEDANRKASNTPASKPTIDPYNPGEAVPMKSDFEIARDMVNNSKVVQTGLDLSPLRLGGKMLDKAVPGASQRVQDFGKAIQVSTEQKDMGTTGLLAIPEFLGRQAINIPGQIAEGVGTIMNPKTDNAGVIQAGLETGANVIPAYQSGKVGVAAYRASRGLGKGVVESVAKGAGSATLDSLGINQADSPKVQKFGDNIGQNDAFYEDFYGTGNVRKAQGAEPASGTVTPPKPHFTNGNEPTGMGGAGQPSMGATTPTVDPMNLTAGANRFTEEVRKLHNLPDRTKPLPQKMAEWAKEAETVNVDDLMSRIEKSDRPTATAPEQIAISARISGLQDELDNLGLQYHEAAKSGVIPQELTDAMDSVRGRLQSTIQAGESVGTEASRTLNARKALVASDNSVAGIIRRMEKEAKKAGRSLTPEELATAEADAARFKALESRIAELESKGAGKATATERRRTVRRATLEKEASSIIEQIKALGEKPTATPKMRGRTGGAVNVGKAPEYIDLYAQLGWNYAKRGFVAVDDIFAEISKVAKEAGHKLTRQELVDAMDAYRLKKAGKQLTAAQKAEIQAKNKFNKQIEKESTRGKAEAEMKAAKAPTKEMTTDQKIRFRERALQSQIRKLDAQIKAGKANPAPTKITSENLVKLEEIRKAKQAQLNAITQPEKASAKAQSLEKKALDAQNATKLREMGLEFRRMESNARREAAKLDAQANRAAKAEDKARLRAEAKAKREEATAMRQENARKLREMSAEMRKVSAPLNRDTRAIANTKAKMQDLENMLKTGDFWGTGQNRVGSTLSDQLETVKWQAQELRKQVDQKIDDISTPKWVKVAREALGIPRFFELGLDAGALMRQGWDVLFQNPSAWFKGLSEGTKAGFNAKYAAKLEREFAKNTEAINLKREGLEIDGVGQHPEYFVSESLSKVPGYGGAERFHKTFQNVARFEMGKAIVKDTRLSKAQRTEALKLVNAMTGRGNAPWANAQILNVFTAPRMYAGQLEMMGAGLHLGKMWKNPAYRKIVIKRTLARLGVITGLYEYAQLTGNTFGIDPEQSDFLKLTVNGVVYDVGAGYTPYYRFVMKTINDWESDKDGNGEMDKSVDLMGSVGQIAKYKVNPLIQSVVGAARGKDAIGDPYFRGRETVDGVARPNQSISADADSLLRTFAPMIGQELRSMLKSEEYDRKSKSYVPNRAYENASTAQKAGSMGLAFAGMGVSSYDVEKNKKFDKTWLAKWAKAFDLSSGSAPTSR